VEVVPGSRIAPTGGKGKRESGPTAVQLSLPENAEEVLHTTPPRVPSSHRLLVPHHRPALRLAQYAKNDGGCLPNDFHALGEE
jgi:hypothetical protein